MAKYGELQLNTMGLNWTIEVILNFISVIPFIGSVIILNRLYIKHKDRIIFFLTLTWLFYGLFWFTNALAYLYLSPDLFRFNKIFLVLASFSILFALEYMNTERIGSIKLSLFTLLNGGLLYSVTLSDAVEEILLNNGDESLQNTGLNKIMITLLSLAVITIYLFYTYKVYNHASEEYRKYSLLHFVGAVIFGPVVLIMFAIEVGIAFAGLNAIISGIGVLMSTIAISKSPQLIYTLPFKIYSLEVIEEKSGLVIYGHHWDKDRKVVRELLIGASLEGINMFAQQALLLGQIKEIILETGIIILKAIPNSKYYATVLSSTGSPVLRENLKNFVHLFDQEFHEQLVDDSPAKLVSEFRRADKLIPVAFPYISA